MGGQKNSGFVWTPTKRRGPIAAEFSTPGPAAIGLPSTFGTNAAVKVRSPAFTISGRHEPKLNSLSPGPGQYNINGLSYKAGKDEPHAPSMHIRPRDPKPFVTPAPGDYRPEKSAKVLDPSPKFSFGVKTDNGNQADIPAPNSYTISSLIGTGKYGGPYQTGPSFTMSARPRHPEDKMKIPGPGAYNEAIVDIYKTQKSPAFSMGQRTNIPSDHTRKPGPGAHSPEKCMQNRGPKFTISGRCETTTLPDTPGPGTYETPSLDVYLERSPRFSFAPRTSLSPDKTIKPSSNTYNLRKCRQDDGPKWTMSPRLQEIGKNNVPGPGTYNAAELDIFLDKQPAYTMRPKTELPTDKGPRPCPNTYSPEKCFQEDGPKWTMATKLQDLKKLNVPGPGTYESGTLNAILEQQPMYSMRPKTELPSDKGPKPAPNAYSPEKCFQEDGPKWTMATKLQDLKKLNVPGPGTYESGTLNAILEQQPMYSMRPKTELPSDKGPKPSPNAYSPEKYSANEGPKWTIAGRLKETERSKVPGPGTYEVSDLDVILDKQPAYSMRLKTELPRDKGPRPSPNTYSPEKYTPDEGPKWTMSPKTELPHDKTPRPSPNAYSPDETVMVRRNPEFSFGIKHSPYMGTLRDQ